MIECEVIESMIVDGVKWKTNPKLERTKVLMTMMKE